MLWRQNTGINIVKNPNSLQRFSISTDFSVSSKGKNNLRLNLEFSSLNFPQTDWMFTSLCPDVPAANSSWGRRSWRSEKVLRKGFGSKAAIWPLARLSPVLTGESIVITEEEGKEEEDLQAFRLRVRQGSYSNYRHICERLLSPQASRRLFARDPLLNQQGPAAGSSMMFIQGMMLTPTLLGCKPGRYLRKSACASPGVGIPWLLRLHHSPGDTSSVHRGGFTPALPRNWFLDTGRNSVSQRILRSRSFPFFLNNLPQLVFNLCI